MEKVLSVTQAAEYLGYSKFYIYKLIHQKQLSHFKPAGLRGKVFFLQEDLEKFIFRNRQSATYEGEQK